MTGTPEPLVLPPDEFAAVKTALEHCQSALAGDSEGVRLWMLDCGELVAKHRARADAAEAKLAEIHAYCRDECEVVNEGLRLTAIVRASDILAITGSETREEAPYDRDFAGPVL